MVLAIQEKNQARDTKSQYFVPFFLYYYETSSRDAKLEVLRTC